MNDINSPLDPFVYNNPYFPTDLSRSQYYYQTGGGVEEQVQQIIMQYAELAGTSPEQIVEGLKGLSEEQVQEQLALMAEEIEEAQRQEEMLRRARQQEDEDVSVEGEEESSMFDVYDPEEFEERQNMIMANVQADNNQQMVEEEEDEPVEQEKTEAQSYREDRYKYGGAKKKFLSKLKKAMNGMAADTLPKVSFDKDDYGQNMLGSFVQGVQKNSQRALEAEAAEKVQETLSQNPQMMMPVMAQYGMQMYNPAATLSENAMGGMDYLRSIAPTNQDIQNSFGNMAGAFANDFLPQQQRGGTLPIFQNTGENNLKQQGRDYFRKIWERTKGVGIPEAQKQQLFDAWYAGQKVEDWKDILPQAPGGNYFNQALTNQMFNNPWGYRAYNNPYLQQFAYAPRYKASVDGKKININNLQDWSNSDLIEVNPVFNRRGTRQIGQGYKLRKPSTEVKITPDSNTVIPEDLTWKNTNTSTQEKVKPVVINNQQNGGPQMIPYDQNYIDQQYGLYNDFYKNYYAPPADGALKRDDGYDAYMYDLREKEKPSRDEIGRLGRMVQSFNVYKRRKNSFPSNTYPGILKSKQTGGQLYLYKNGGLPKFQGPDISQVLAKPEIDPNLVYNTQQYNKEYDLPQETLDITETYKPNFLQGVARAMPYMNFANNIYDRIFAENQRAKIRERATSIESTATPFADYKGRFSEYGAYQPNLQGFQGMGSAQYGGMIGDGEYYLSDSEIQDIINMGGEVEFLED